MLRRIVFLALPDGEWLRPTLVAGDASECLTRLRAYLIPHAHRAAGDDLCPQAAPVQQGLLEADAGTFFQVTARLAQLDASQSHGADGKSLADQVVERNALSQEIPACGGVGDVELVLLDCGRNCFAFDKRDLLGWIDLAMLECALALSVSISRQPAIGDRLNLLDALHRQLRGRGDLDREQSASEHG